MLNRDEIYNYVKNNKLFESDSLLKEIEVIDNAKLFPASSSFQPGSFDLHIGDIFVPEAKCNNKDKLSPQKSVIINAGETILVKSLETLNFPDNIGGMCFAPARFSLEGLLIVNIGHIDPGFSGKLHFTIVNLGKDGKEIKNGELLATMLLYECKSNSGYKSQEGVLNQDENYIVSKLSHSFMDFNNIVDKKINGASIYKPLWITIISIISTLIVTLVITICASNYFNNDINKYKDELRDIKYEYKNKTDQLQNKIDELVKEIQSLKEQKELGSNDQTQ